MKIKLSPFKTCILTFSFVILFLWVIHSNIESVFQYISKMTPLAKALLLILCLILFGILVAYSKIREAGYSGQLTSKSTKLWKPLILEISIFGFLNFLFFLFQIFVFSVLLYFVVLKSGYFSLLILAATFFIVVYSSIKLLEVFGIIENKEKKSRKAS